MEFSDHSYGVICHALLNFRIKLFIRGTTVAWTVLHCDALNLTYKPKFLALYECQNKTKSNLNTVKYCGFFYWTRLVYATIHVTRVAQNVFIDYFQTYDVQNNFWGILIEQNSKICHTNIQSWSVSILKMFKNPILTFCHSLSQGYLIHVFNRRVVRGWHPCVYVGLLSRLS